MSTETDIQNSFQAFACKDPWVRLWRNVVGVLFSATGQRIKVGLCTGSSDLIGLRSVVVTPEMVGRRLAIFTAVEMKKPKGKRSDEQKAYIAEVKRLGGIAIFADSIDDIQKLYA